MFQQGATYIRLGCKQCKCITGNDEYLHCTKCFYPPSPIWVTPARTPHTTKQRDCQLRGQDKRCWRQLGVGIPSRLSQREHAALICTQIYLKPHVLSATHLHTTPLDNYQHIMKIMNPGYLTTPSCKTISITIQTNHILTRLLVSFIALNCSQNTSPGPRASVRTWCCGFQQCFILHFILKRISSYKSLTALYNSQSDTCLLHSNTQLQVNLKVCDNSEHMAHQICHKNTFKHCSIVHTNTTVTNIQYWLLSS